MEKIEIMGECGTDYFETFAHNLSTSNRVPRLQRSVAYNNIPSELVTEFETLSKNKSEKMLLELNSWLVKNNCNPKSKKKNV